MAASPDFEMRLVRLEENSYFQDERIKQLEAHILAQQKQIDSLSGSVTRLRQRLELLEYQNKVQDKPVAEPPPHYL